MPENVYHIVVTTAGGAGTYLINHNLAFKPTTVSVIPVVADTVAVTTANTAWARCSVDDTATAFAITVGGNGTFEIIYG